MGAVLLIGLTVAVLHRCGVRLCLFHRLTGLPCLTCGSTRAAAALASGDVAGAFARQPLAVAVAACLVAASALYSAFLVLGRRVVAVRLEPVERRLACLAIVALALLNWLYLVWRGA